MILDPEDEAFNEIERQAKQRKEAVLQALHSENERLGLYKDAYGQQEPVAHWSDCGVHSEPAYPKSECDCGGFLAQEAIAELENSLILTSEVNISNNFKQPQRTEQNFCPRCGKRTNDIHTCTPPQRTWVGLTDEERIDILVDAVRTKWDDQEIIKAIETKLKEKNT